MPDEIVESSDEEWDRAEFRRLQRAKHRRLQKRKLSQREDQSNDRAGQDNAAEDVATQQDTASTKQGPTKGQSHIYIPYLHKKMFPFQFYSKDLVTI